MNVSRSEGVAVPAVPGAGERVSVVTAAG
ncbi:hydrolase, partial [Streptomyces albidoflavus]